MNISSSAFFISLLYTYSAFGLYELVYQAPLHFHLKQYLYDSIVLENSRTIHDLLLLHVPNEKERILHEGWPYIGQLKDPDMPEDNCDPQIYYKNSESIKQLCVDCLGSAKGAHFFAILTAINNQRSEESV